MSKDVFVNTVKFTSTIFDTGLLLSASSIAIKATPKVVLAANISDL